MLPSLFLVVLLMPTQAGGGSTPDVVSAEPDQPTKPIPVTVSMLPVAVPTLSPPAAARPAPPERWCLMRELQGTYLGDLLYDNRLRLYGWTDLSFTARRAWRLLAGRRRSMTSGSATSWKTIPNSPWNGWRERER
jgi:hypothetical protein